MSTKIDINIIGDAIGKIAESVTELTKAVSKYLGSADARRVAKCIRTGDKIVIRLRELGIEDGEILKLAKKWDKYNN